MQKTKAKTRKAAQKDPAGGLTAAGRAAYRKKTGAHLKPGVKGPADTPEKMRRKGSFLRRHYATLRGPLLDADGQPTRLALQAHAWGEPVPKTKAAARKLAAKGQRLLQRYAKAVKAKSASKSGRTSSTKPGLYANIAKARKRAAHGGRPVRKKGAPGAPTDAAFRAAAKTAKPRKGRGSRRRGR